MCAGNVTWRGRSVQCCTCFKWVQLKCSLLSFSKFITHGSSHSWSCSPAASLLLLEFPHLPILRLLRISPAYILPLFHSLPSANATLLPHPRLQTPSAHFVYSPSAPSALSHATGCSSTPHQSDGVVVRASALQSVDQGFISLVES